MSEAKHTPGPWRAQVEQSTYRLRIRVTATTPKPDRRYTVAVLTETSGTPEDVATTHADAALIAAAPDMADAIRFCLVNAGGPPVDMLSRLRAALLNATGEQL